MKDVALIDLDQRPELAPKALALFATCAPGRDHVVCGIPARMGMTPTMDDLRRCAGVLIEVQGAHVHAVLAICPYSDEQVTFWGPACAVGVDRAAAGARLLAAARRALGVADFASVRTLVDVRNRELRRFLLGHGFTVWKDDHVYERPLDTALPEAAHGVRLSTARHHATLAHLLTQSFADSGHARDLALREREGFRHYHLEESGEIVAAAAVEDGGRRAWLKLIAVRDGRRGGKRGRRLLSGILQHEAQRGFAAIGLEVLVDNAVGIALFERMGFQRRFTATVLVGPV